MPLGEQATHGRAGEIAGGLLDTLGLRRARVACAVSGQSAVVKRLVLPAMSRAELREGIPREASEHLRFAPGEVRLDYHLIRTAHALPAGALDVLLVAARRDRVDERLAVIAATGRQPAVIDVEAFALANAYQTNYPHRADALAALVHVGRGATTVCLLEAGQVVLTRDLGVGGATCLAGLERELGLAPAAARRILHGHRPADDAGVSAVLREVHLQLIQEIRKTLDFYWSTTKAAPLSRIVLSGGASRIDGLATLLEAEFQAGVEWCDPFREILRPAGVVGSELNGPSFTVAVGLALRREADR